MKIRYNAPVILTYALISVLIMALTKYFLPSLSENWFAVPGRGNFSITSFRNWVNLFTHVIGHTSWEHLIGNFSFILLLGPLLEENYKSLTMLFIIVITALTTGIINVLFFPTLLMGASGVVFMMILLASFTNITRGEIPMTFILVLVLYLGGQIIMSINTNNISYTAHIAGGFCGSVFGFIFRTKRR